ncbi:helix-turn-helix domain-containing protein [Tessaracoccus sp. HDW20]|nr:HTH domain-containing protein [Tessaracoccus coleopterorum]NHB83667.1 helix-turn-helix domain-containing protein [Tessaracoccus coleopterorum]
MLTVSETAKKFGVSRQSIYRMINTVDDNGDPVVPSTRSTAPT